MCFHTASLPAHELFCLMFTQQTTTASTSDILKNRQITEIFLEIILLDIVEMSRKLGTAVVEAENMQK